jgi:hypothetical protein
MNDKQEETVYVVSPVAQEESVSEYCMMVCGKILMGILEIEGGHFLPCYEEECPYTKKSMEIGVDAETGETIIGRLLADPHGPEYYQQSFDLPLPVA